MWSLFVIYRCTPEQRDAILHLCEAEPKITIEGFFSFVEDLMDEAEAFPTDLGPWISLAIRKLTHGSPG